MIHFIYASDVNGCIAKNGELPWHDKEELQHFKQKTMGATVIMGYKTWLSLGEKPLAGRRNIVLTKQSREKKENVSFYSLEKMLDVIIDKPNDEYYVIGGAEIFKLFEPYVKQIHQSVYKGDPIAGDDLIYYRHKEKLTTVLVDMKELHNFSCYTYMVVSHQH